MQKYTSLPATLKTRVSSTGGRQVIYVHGSQTGNQMASVHLWLIKMMPCLLFIGRVFGRWAVPVQSLCSKTAGRVGHVWQMQEKVTHRAKIGWRCGRESGIRIRCQ